MEDGIYSMLAKLDPYTNYIPEDRIEDYRTMATGQYAGVGASINRVDDRLLITMPFEGFAAQRAGILAGDEIIEIDGQFPDVLADEGFVRYTKLQCPNGEAIHLLAQSNISDAQLVRARNILKFFLSDVPGSEFGSDKSVIMNTMGINEATLLLINGSDNGVNEPNLDGQYLFEEEIATEGHAWYQNNNFDLLESERKE
mgnify:CR=1 FL=1